MPRFNVKHVLWLSVSVVLLVLLALAGLSLCSAFGPAASTHQLREKTFQLVSRIQGESKLVVATQAVTVQLDRADSWYLFNRLYLGETVVKLRIDNCRVQYYIVGREVRMEDFRFDPQAKRLVATLPHPVLDDSFVDVPSDPARWSVYKASGWARFDKNQMEEETRSALRSKVLEVARQAAGWDQHTDLVAKESLKELIQQVYQDRDLKVEVRWR